MQDPNINIEQVIDYLTTQYMIHFYLFIGPSFIGPLAHHVFFNFISLFGQKFS